MTNVNTEPERTVFLLDVDNTLLENERLTTVLVRQGHYAFDPKETELYPATDVTVARLDELLGFGLEADPQPPYSEQFFNL